MRDATLQVVARTESLTFGQWGRALRALARWRRRQHTTMMLEALDDALLKDIGVFRCEIPRVARVTSADPEQR